MSTVITENRFLLQCVDWTFGLSHFLLPNGSMHMKNVNPFCNKLFLSGCEHWYIWGDRSRSFAKVISKFHQGQQNVALCNNYYKTGRPLITFWKNLYNPFGNKVALCNNYYKTGRRTWKTSTRFVIKFLVGLWILIYMRLQVKAVWKGHVRSSSRSTRTSKPHIGISCVCRLLSQRIDFFFNVLIERLDLVIFITKRVDAYEERQPVL